MERLFSTHDVHQRERFSYWHDVACKNLVEHECQPQSSRSFHAEIESAMLADIGLLLFEKFSDDNSTYAASCSAR
jgi:AraC family transcriptional regulator, positive regulator of tynA and feaB